MKTVMILAHPELEKSIGNKRIAQEVADKNPNVEVRDIFSLYPDYKIDIEAEQKVLLSADTIIFQYPFWWYNMPAILKQWFDQVFNFNFAYGPEGDKLKGKNFLLSFTIGGPSDAYSPLGYNHFRIEDLTKPMEQTAYLSQMNYLPPIYEHGMVFIPGVYNTKEAVEKGADRQAARLLEVITNLENESPEEKIKSFIYEWFSNFDKLADDGYFNSFIANGCLLKFPEGEFIGHEGFSEWYKNIKETIKPGNQHSVESISISEENGFYMIDLSVKMKAEKTSGESIQLNVKENWKIEITRDARIKLHHYLVEKV